MAWHRVACALLLVVAMVAVPRAVQAQQGLTPVTGGGVGRYVGAAPTELQGALDKLNAGLPLCRWTPRRSRSGRRRFDAASLSCVC